MIARLCAAFDAETRRRALAIGTAIALAYASAAATGLPERLWAVMTALIVMRPTVESTLVAGLNRALGTAVGALLGLAGVALFSRGWSANLGGLAIVVSLGYASAAANGLRAAPIGALIVLSAMGDGGHLATGVATLRLAQVGLGGAVATLVGFAMVKTRGEARMRSGCARLVRGMARRLAAAADASRAPTAPAPIDATEAALTRLGGLASDADRFGRWPRRPPTAGEGASALVASTRRVAQDVGVLSRLIAASRRDPDNAARLAASAAAHSLGRAAVALECGAPDGGDEQAVGVGALASPLELLQTDVGRLIATACAAH